jgi:hypothetical protein
MRTAVSAPSALLTALALALALASAGCAPAYVENAAGLQHLSPGMDRPQVNRVMDGRKHDTRYFETTSIQFEFWLYETGYNHDTKKYTCAPIIFESGRVIGWGRDFTDRRLHMGSGIRADLCMDEE